MTIDSSDWVAVLEYLTEHFGKGNFEEGAAQAKSICEFHNKVRVPVKRLSICLERSWGSSPDAAI